MSSYLQKHEDAHLSIGDFERQAPQYHQWFHVIEARNWSVYKVRVLHETGSSGASSGAGLCFTSPLPGASRRRNLGNRRDCPAKRKVLSRYTRSKCLLGLPRDDKSGQPQRGEGKPACQGLAMPYGIGEHLPAGAGRPATRISLTPNIDSFSQHSEEFRLPGVSPLRLENAAGP